MVKIEVLGSGCANCRERDGRPEGQLVTLEGERGHARIRARAFEAAARASSSRS
jgi:hypothetical protein